MFKINFKRREIVLSMSLNILRYITQSIYLRLLVIKINESVDMTKDLHDVAELVY